MILSWIYKGIYVFTNFFPRHGWRIVDTLILFLGGNAIVYRIIIALYRNRMKRIKTPHTICVLADVNIGDAIAMQGIILALREFFPDATIEYIVGKSSLPLIVHNPHITQIHPLYTTAPFPDEKARNAISTLIQEKQYDLIVNMSPFLPSNIAPSHIGFLGLAFFMLRRRAEKKQAHLFSSPYMYIHTILKPLYTPSQKKSLPFPFLFLSKNASLHAQEFLSKQTQEKRPLIFFNGETISPYTRVPLVLQRKLIEKLVSLPCSVIIPFHKETSHDLIDYIHTLPEEKQNKCIFLSIPIELDTYAALMDMSDLVITGDTGPLHIAAAYKQITEETYSCNNSTAVYSLFGATDAYMYGYDSFRPLFTPAPQTAPSRVYMGTRKYRTLAHINKNAIYGEPSLFFTDIDIDSIVSDIKAYLHI